MKRVKDYTVYLYLYTASMVSHMMLSTYMCVTIQYYIGDMMIKKCGPMCKGGDDIYKI